MKEISVEVALVYPPFAVIVAPIVHVPTPTNTTSPVISFMVHTFVVVL